MAGKSRKRSTAQWDALRPAYRARLERRGITRDYYASGGSLAYARGHGQTPEKPSRAIAKPEKYSRYLTKRYRDDEHVLSLASGIRTVWPIYDDLDSDDQQALEYFWLNGYVVTWHNSDPKVSKAAARVRKEGHDYVAALKRGGAKWPEPGIDGPNNSQNWAEWREWYDANFVKGGWNG